MEKKPRANICLVAEESEDECLLGSVRWGNLRWATSVGATCVGQRPLGQPPLGVRFSRRLWGNGVFGKLVNGNVLRGRRPYAGSGQKPRGRRG